MTREDDFVRALSALDQARLARDRVIRELAHADARVRAAEALMAKFRP